MSGHDGISGAIERRAGPVPGLCVQPVSGPDAHHQQARFQWGLGPRDAEPVVVGFDVLSTDPEGRIADRAGVPGPAARLTLRSPRGPVPQAIRRERLIRTAASPPIWSRELRGVSVQS